MKLNKKWFVEIDISELTDLELKFLASDIMLEHSGKRIDSDAAVEKLYEINNELCRRLRQ